AIDAVQFDLQTIVTHELGHALGLGHSTDPASVMFSNLDAGQVKRGLTVQDLKLPDHDDTGGSHALHAVPPILAALAAMTVPTVAEASTPLPAASPAARTDHADGA